MRRPRLWCSLAAGPMKRPEDDWCQVHCVWCELSSLVCRTSSCGMGEDGVGHVQHVYIHHQARRVGFGKKSQYLVAAVNWLIAGGDRLRGDSPDVSFRCMLAKGHVVLVDLGLVHGLEWRRWHEDDRIGFVEAARRGDRLKVNFKTTEKVLEPLCRRRRFTMTV